MKKNSRIYVAGHTGLVGSAIYRNLVEKDFTEIITRTHEELDLTDTLAVAAFFEVERPEYVFLAAAKVGGIIANSNYRADFIYENLMIQNNVIHQSYINGVKKLMFLGSTCIYPKNCPQPIKEEYLLTGPLEDTNEAYSIAKIAGIKMCESYNLQYGTNFICVMPTNLYGPRDNFDLERSHVLPALIRKMHLGKALQEGNWEVLAEDLNKRPIEGIDGSQSRKQILIILEKYGVKLENKDFNNTFNDVAIEIWGSGNPLREFLWSEEMADACVFLMENRDFKDIIGLKRCDPGNNMTKDCHINIGTGREVSISQLAEIVKGKTGFRGGIYFNQEKPDGTFRKLTDVSRLKVLGWKYNVELDDGINRLYKWYKASISSLVDDLIVGK